MNLELNQKRSFAGERQFRFKDQNTVLVTLKNLKNRKEYLIDLAAIDHKDHRHFVFAKKLLMVFVVFLSASLILYFTPLIELLKLPYKDWFVSVFVILTLISFILFISFTRIERVFKSRHAKVPLLIFYNGLPNSKEFKSFIEKIKAISKKRFEKLNLDLQQQYAGELKTIRRVMDEGVISQSDYERAKNKLLNKSGK